MRAEDEDVEEVRGRADKGFQQLELPARERRLGAPAWRRLPVLETAELFVESCVSPFRCHRPHSLHDNARAFVLHRAFVRTAPQEDSGEQPPLLPIGIRSTHLLAQQLSDRIYRYYGRRVRFLALDRARSQHTLERGFKMCWHAAVVLRMKTGVHQLLDRVEEHRRCFFV